MNATPTPTSSETSRSGALEAWPFAEFARVGAENGVTDPPVVDGTVGPTVVRDGRELANFASINFLDLSAAPEVRRWFTDGIDAYGLTTGGSRMTQGINRPHLELEQALCRATGHERAITFATGLLANIGFLHAMTSAVDLGAGVRVNNRDSVVVVDREAHWSLWKAVEGLHSGGRAFAFRHNDPRDLDRVLRRAGRAKTVVVFESVYSAGGDVAPMPELLEVCRRHGAVSYVDDANGFLVYGPPERRFADEFRAMREHADFVMVSFSKSVGLEGGAVAGPADAVGALEVLSGTSMFTASMQPPTAGAAARIVDLLHTDRSIVDRYLERVERFRDGIARTGATLGPAGSYILSIEVNDDDVAVELRDRFVEEGYLVPVFFYPAVPRDRSLIRLIVNDGHTDEQLDGFLDTLARLRQELGF